MSKITKLVKVTTNNQVAIPSAIAKNLKLSKGCYLEVISQGTKIVMTPKRLVDVEEFSMYERYVREGRRQLKAGSTVDWKTVKKKLE